MILLLLSIFILILFIVFIFIKVKYRFWTLQPFYHKYNIVHALGPKMRAINNTVKINRYVFKNRGRNYIQKTTVKRDAKFNRCQSDTTFHISVSFVENVNCFATFGIVAGLYECFDYVLNNTILNRLPIGSDSMI